MEEFQNQAIEETLKFIKEQDKSTYQELEGNASMKSDVVSAIKVAAAEMYKLGEDLKDVPDEGAKYILEKNLSKERIEMLKSGLEIPTFQLYLSKSVYDGKYMAYFMKDESTLLKAPQVLHSLESVDNVSDQQWGSIVVEAIMLAIAATGFQIRAINPQQAIEIVIKNMTPAYKQSLEEFKNGYSSSNSHLGKATALFNLIKVTAKIGTFPSLFFKVVGCLSSYMSTNQRWNLYASHVSVIMMAVAWGGIIEKVLIHMFAHAIPRAGLFNRKISNIEHLEKIYAEFEPKTEE